MISVHTDSPLAYYQAPPHKRVLIVFSCCQVEDRAKLHDGIVRDLERQAKKKVVNQQQLVQQQELTKLYRKAEEKETSE